MFRNIVIKEMYETLPKMIADHFNTLRYTSAWLKRYERQLKAGIDLKIKEERLAVFVIERNNAIRELNNYYADIPEVCKLLIGGIIHDDEKMIIKAGNLAEMTKREFSKHIKRM